MKQLSKLTATILGAVMFLLTLVACGTTPFAWKVTPPETVKVGEELVFRDYITEEEGANYTLFVTFTNPVTNKTITKEKQSSLIYTLNYSVEYTFTVEREIKGKTASIEARVEALPKAPAFTKPIALNADTGSTNTFANLFSLSGAFVTPTDLMNKIKFESVTIEKAAYSATNEESGLIETQTIDPSATEYTFQYGAVYTFLVTAENKSGKAQMKLVVSTVDEAKISTKAEISYDAKTKTLSWTAIEDATAYRVAYGQTKADITETSYRLDGVADGEYEVSVTPIYGDEIYADSTATKVVSVGVVKTPLRLTQNNYTLTWIERSLAESYTVTENGVQTTLPATELSYTLKGEYKTHDKVTVTVVANFDYEGEKSTSEPATAEINYGTVSFKAMDATLTSLAYKEVEGIEFIEIGDGLTETWVMVEFTGKNAPNIAVRATQGFNELKYDKNNTYWSNAGALLMNSLVGEKADKLYVTRGFFSNNNGNGYFDVRGYASTVKGVEHAPGLRYLKDGVNYVMILGFSLYTGDPTRPDSDALLTAIYYTVDEEGELTEIYRAEEVMKSAWHSLPGKKTIVYPNIATEENDTGVTFTYYPAAASLAEVVNGSTSPNKAKLKTLLGV